MYTACILSGDLFEQIGSQKKRSGSLAPKKFVNRLRKDNELFRSHMHQDAQEFLNYLLNEIVEILEKEAKKDSPQPVGQDGTPAKPEIERLGFDVEDDMGDLEKDYNDKDESEKETEKVKKPKTWVHDIFEGVLENKTRCLRCENVTSRDESFLDLSLDIMQNSSVSACLRNFEHIEMMAGDEKFYCNICSSLQVWKTRHGQELRALQHFLLSPWSKKRHHFSLSKPLKLIFQESCRKLKGG